MSEAFPTTRWTRILAAQGSSTERTALLRELLGAYWQPLYASLRRRGLPRAEAEDAVQNLCDRLLRTDVLGRLDPTRGRLRGYLKTALEHEVRHGFAREQAQKRGGGQVVAMEVESAEALAADERRSPEEAFDHAWARTLFDRALVRLRSEHERERRAGPFAVVEGYFRSGLEVPLSELAAAHQLSESQLKSLLHRARARFRALLEEEVRETLAEPSPETVAAELDALVRSLG